MDALFDLTIESRDEFFVKHRFPQNLPFPILSIVGTLNGFRTDGFYPLYKFLQKVHGSESDGVVAEPDQCVPGSMKVRVPGLSHTLPISDPVPFWGAMFAGILNCRPETHDDTPVYVYFRILRARSERIKAFSKKKPFSFSNPILFSNTFPIL